MKLVSSQPLSLGEMIPPGNIHGVSVSLPRFRDVIGYEEKDPATLDYVKTGYPRFVTHPYILKVSEYLQKKNDLEEKPILLSSPSAYKLLTNSLDLQLNLKEDDGILFLTGPFTDDVRKKISQNLQHTGYIISSRRAEDYLVRKGLLETKFQEESVENGGQRIKNYLANIYGISSNDVFLASSGMNAVYASYATINEVRREKQIWIQFGWLYVDTIEIIKKFSKEPIVFTNVYDLDSLEEFVRENKSQIAGIVTEVPTNPLIEVPDMDRLKSIVTQYDLPLVIDISVAGAPVVDLYPYCDLLVESLTKFASGHADVLMGSVICTKHSKYYDQFKNSLSSYLEEPYQGDRDRLAHSIDGYSNRVINIAKNTEIVAKYFESHPAIKRVYWCNSDAGVNNFNKIKKTPSSLSGVVAIDLKGSMEHFYDSLAMFKGPSFGTEFTLNMLYMYLAHYDLVTASDGREYLESIGIDPELLRISIGLEDAQILIAKYEEALSRS